MSSIEEIINGCQKGKRSAQTALYNRFGSYLYGTCMLYCTNKADAKDVLQEAFIQIYKHIRRFENRGDGALEAWMRQITINAVLNYNRNNSKHYTNVSLDNMPFIKRHTFSFDEYKEDSRFKMDDILKAIQKLPEGYRMVFNLYVLEGYTHEEIAGILSISKNTSKSQLSKARTYLKKILGITKEKQFIDNE